MPVTNGKCAIAVMAKAPRPGRVKTRLQPALTPEAAMALSAAFLRDITENIRAAAREAPIDGWIAYAPAGLEMLFNGMLASGTWLVLADGAIEPPDAVSGLRPLPAARGTGAVRAALRCGVPAELRQSHAADRDARARRAGAGRARRPRGAGAGRGRRLLRHRHESARTRHLFADIAWSTEIGRGADAGPGGSAWGCRWSSWSRGTTWTTTRRCNGCWAARAGRGSAMRPRRRWRACGRWD